MQPNRQLPTTFNYPFFRPLQYIQKIAESKQCKTRQMAGLIPLGKGVQQISRAKKFMDRCSGSSSGSHGSDHRRCTCGNIAARPDTLSGSFASRIVDDDIAFLANGQAGCGSRDQRIGSIADGMDDAIEGKRVL
jgi:hypothetical protein